MIQNFNALTSNIFTIGVSFLHVNEQKLCTLLTLNCQHLVETASIDIHAHLFPYSNKKLKILITKHFLKRIKKSKNESIAEQVAFYSEVGLN